ncbi:MAG TPA: OadG family transporter subunit [Opitutus sp.]|nr:OadG family transporter subunit [Opitutus sp.]
MAFSPARPALLALAEYPNIGDSILFQLNGLIVVFIALGSIWGLLELMGAAFRLAARRRHASAHRPHPAAHERPSAPAAPAAATDATDPRVLAVIAAAVHLTLRGQPHRITAVTPEQPTLDWAREGRRAIFASHKTH